MQAVSQTQAFLYTSLLLQLYPNTHPWPILKSMKFMAPLWLKGSGPSSPLILVVSN